MPITLFCSLIRFLKGVEARMCTLGEKGWVEKVLIWFDQTRINE